MDTTTAADVLFRIDALKELGADCGGGRGQQWILLDGYNNKVTTNHPHAIQLVELLGISDASMKDNFGRQWRGAFRKKNKRLGIGFTHREFADANFVSVGDEIDSDAPNRGNIVNKGSDIARAIRQHIEDAVATAAARDDAGDDAGDDTIVNEEDTMADPMVVEEMEAVVASIDDYLSAAKMSMGQIFDFISINDMMQTQCVSTGWRDAAWELSESRLATLPPKLIPLAVALICNTCSLSGIYRNLLRSDTLIFVFNRQVGLGVRKRKAPPTEWSLENAVQYISDEILYRGDVPTEVQSFVHQTLRSLPSSGNEVTLNFHDKSNKKRSTSIQFIKKQRACNPDASEKSRKDFVSRIANTISDSTVQWLGNNYSAELASAVFNKIGERFNLVLLDASKTCYTFAELVAASVRCKFSLNGTTRFLQSLIHMRPELKTLVFPTGCRRGMSQVINSGNLPFETTEMELVISKKNNISAWRKFWCLRSPAHQMEKLIESSIVDGSFRNSIEFSNLHSATVVVFGIDKAAENTGAAIRVANRDRGNSSDYTQLLAAVMDAAECHSNFLRTFFNESYPLKQFLQSIVNDWYQSIVLKIGGQCRCVTFTPLPRQDPCTLRHINVNVAQPHTSATEDEEDINWHDDRLPPEVPAHSGVVTVRLVRNSTNKYIGLQFLCVSTQAVLSSVCFRECMNLSDEHQLGLPSDLTACSEQIVGFPAVDYKCSLCMSGIGGSSSSYCCTSCLRNKNDFGLPSEALQRLRKPDEEPTTKDAPLRTGSNSVMECYKRSAKLNGNGAINLSANDAKAVNDRNGSVVNEPCMYIHPKKNTGGPTHIGGGIISHLIINILDFLKPIDEKSQWWQDALAAPEEVDKLLEQFLPPKSGERTPYYDLLTANRQKAKHAINSQRKVDVSQAALDKLRKSQEEVLAENFEGSSENGENNTSLSEQALVDNLNNATKELEEALKNCLDHASATTLAHLNKKRHALNKLRPLITKYLKSSNKRPQGKMQNGFRAGIRAVGGKFLTQHGGSELTTDNGMDVIDRFKEVVAFVVNILPPDTEDGKKVREAFEKYSKVAEELRPVLRLLKSQDKCTDEDEVLRILNALILAWEEAFPGKYFIKLHHLMQHVYEIIKLYGMYGILSEESMEALHKRINDLMSLSKSQKATKRIAATNAKAQTIGKTEVADNLKIIKEKSTGKKRGSYNINQTSQSVQVAESGNRYQIVTYNGEEFAVIENGEGHLPIKFLELYDLLACGRVPREWMETIHSSEKLTNDQKEQLSYYES